MAWRYQVAGILKETNGSRVQADIKYYDDANPANTPTPSVFLHAQTFFFDPVATNAEMQSMIQQEGARARTALNRASALASSFPNGFTGAVP
jgi:hypothetical protein